MEESDPSSSGTRRYLFWEKPAFQDAGLNSDKPQFHEIPFDKKFWELMGALESKAVKRTKLFSEVSPKNPSVKKWIMSIWDGYPECKDEVVDDLLNVFRDSLFTRSKERNRIVGLLLAPDRLLLIHCRKDASLAEMDDQVITADIVLHSRNLLRAAMIYRGQDGLTFSAFEQNRRLSKGFADFWQIDPDEVAWESIGSLILNVELEAFRWPIQVPIEPEQLDELIHGGEVSMLGHIRIGNQSGTITIVEVLGKQMNFSQFMDFYVTEKEQLEEFRTQYRKLVPLNSIESFDPDLKSHYDFEEDTGWVYKIEATGATRFLKKEHPKFTVCFFTSQPPGIRARASLTTLLSKSIFESNSLSIWHPELETSNESVKIGNLSVYNKIPTNDALSALTKDIIDLRKDASSNKTRAILKMVLCDLWIENAKSPFIFDLFTSIKDAILSDVNFEFKQNGFLDKERVLEFKSASDFRSSPSEFVNKILLPTTRKYFNSGKPTRYCILYGVEDNLRIIPLAYLKNDDATQIENLANEISFKEGYAINVYPIPTQGKGMILMVLIIPIYDNYNE